MHSLRERHDDLVPLNLTDLLERMLTALKQQSLFRVSERSARFLQIDADALATQLATHAHRLPHTLGSAANDAQVASVYWGAHADRTATLLQNLAAMVTDQLRTAIVDSTATSPAAFVESLLHPLSALTGPAQLPGFHYPFDARASNQRVQRLTTRDQRSTHSVLDAHHVTVTLTGIDTLPQALEAGVHRAMTTQFPALDPVDAVDVADIITEQAQGTHTDLQQVRHTMLTAGLGVIKREVQLRYLEYLRDTLGTSGAAPALADLVRRLRRLDAYLANDQRPDGDFLVSYAGSRVVNYRDLFGQANALDQLPIVPLIEGTLGSVADHPRGEQVWTFGLKLKLDGSVNREGANAPRVFEYYVAQLNPDHPQHAARQAASADDPAFAPRVLRLALLYAVVFTDFGNLAADPLMRFERDILPALRGTDEAAKQAALRQLVQTITQPEVVTTLRSLRRWLHQQLRRHATFPPRTFTADLVLTRAILERDLDRILIERTPVQLLAPNGATVRRALRLGDPHITSTALAHLGVRLHVHVARYAPVDTMQTFDLDQAPTTTAVLPVLIAPRTASKPLYQTYFQRYALITIPFTSAALTTPTDRPPDAAAFVARFSYALLSYVGLRAVLALLPAPPLTPLLRLHTGSVNEANDQGGDAAIVAISKVLAHVLSMDGSASTQGLNVAELLDAASRTGRPPATLRGSWPYKLRNGLSSLYAPLPKRLTFATPTPPGMERVAVLVVGSRVADRRRDGQTQLTTMYGEALGIVHTESTATVQPLRRFATTDQVERFRAAPTALMDMVAYLRASGYQHIVYVARAPAAATLFSDTSTLRDDLFWLAPSIIGALRQAQPDAVLYPVFLDTYRALKRHGTAARMQQAYDLHDPRDLQTVLTDPNKQTVVFYALFNGQHVGTDTDARVYNGVVTYATLLNHYGDVLDDRDLHVGLLADGPLKTTLLRSLLAVHYARYEAAVRQEVSLKLNPYAAIIGDRTLGGEGGFPHMSGPARFNVLAFLAEVRAILGSLPSAAAAGPDHASTQE